MLLLFAKRSCYVRVPCSSEKNDKKSKPDLLVSQLRNVNVSGEYGPFICHGSVSLADTPSKKPITIMRDPGTSQSLFLDNVLLFCSQSDTGMTMLLQGVDLGIFNVLFCLKSPVVNGPVVLGVRLPVQGVDLIWGNYLAEGKVVVNPQMPCNEETLINAT